MRPRKQVDVPEVVRLYESGMSQEEVAKQCGVSQWLVSQRLREAGKKTRPRHWKIANVRRYALNEHALDVLDDGVAWIVGFLLSDGFVSERGYQFGARVAVKDEAVLEVLREFFGYEGPVRPHTTTLKATGKQYKMCVLEMCSKVLVGKLRGLGVVPSKTGHEKVPNWVEGEFRQSFIRGVFDGDGSLVRYKHKNQKPQWAFQIVGTHELLVGVQSILMSSLGLKRTKLYRQPSNNHYVLRYVGNKQVPRIMMWLYEGAELMLTRKHDRFLQMMEEIR